MPTHLRVLLAALVTAGCVSPADDLDDTSELQAELGTSNVRWNRIAGLDGLGQITTARNQDGSLAVFGVTGAGALRFAKQTTPSGSAYDVVDLGGGAIQDLSVAQNTDGRLEVFVIGGDGAIYHQWQTAANATTWSGWRWAGGSALRDLAAARNADGRLQLLVVGGNSMVYERHQLVPNGGLSPWAWVGGVGVTQIAVAPYPSGRLALLGIDPEGEVVLTAQPTPNAAFAGWTTLGGTDIAELELARNADGRLELFAIGGNTMMYGKWQTSPEYAGWSSGWYSYGTSGVQDLDSTADTSGALHMFVVGGDGQIHHRAQNQPNGGSSWRPHLGGVGFAEVEAERNSDGRLEVFGLTASGSVYRAWQMPGGAWATVAPAPVIGSFTSNPGVPRTDQPVTLDWTVTFAPGCNAYQAIEQTGAAGARTHWLWDLGARSLRVDPLPLGKTTFTLVAQCAESVGSFELVETRRVLVVDVVAPPKPAVSLNVNPQPGILDEPMTASWNIGVPTGCTLGSRLVLHEAVTPAGNGTYTGGFSRTLQENLAASGSNTFTPTIRGGGSLVVLEAWCAGAGAETKATFVAMKERRTMTSTIALTAQPYSVGYAPFAGLFTLFLNNPGARALELRNVSPHTLFFVKPGHSTAECNDPSAVVVAQPNATANLADVFGVATPQLPLAIVACKGGDSTVVQSVAVSVTYQYLQPQ